MFEWKYVKVKPPPAGHSTARAKRGRWRYLARWPRSEKLQISIKWRGGAESWWLVEARGSSGVFPGHAALEDVMNQVLNEGRSDPPSYVDLTHPEGCRCGMRAACAVHLKPEPRR